jgi:hypothetical protein
LPLYGDEVAVLVDLELPVTRVVDGAAIGQAEEAAAIDGEIEWILGCRDVALGELLDYRGEFGTDTDIAATGAASLVPIPILLPPAPPSELA